MKFLKITMGASIAALVWLLSGFLQAPVATTMPGTTTAAAVPVGKTKMMPGKVSDFDGTFLSTSNGMRWLPTTDKIVGGTSTAVPSSIAGGAGGSAGAMRIEGVVNAGQPPWAWAGIMLNPAAQPMDPVDARACTELVFQARGDGRELAVLLFSGTELRAAPAIVRIRPGRDWGEVRLPLADFAGADLSRLRAIAVTVALPAGPYRFDVDAVEIR
jgi:Complex I intermediate-associated protein 30 (CIA30)